MSCLWYSAKKVQGLHIQIDFKCSTPTTNSGILYHSLEIQIDDTSKGIHHTGAAYDIEARSFEASLPDRRVEPLQDRVQGNAP